MFFSILFFSHGGMIQDHQLGEDEAGRDSEEMWSSHFGKGPNSNTFLMNILFHNQM